MNRGNIVHFVCLVWFKEASISNGKLWIFIVHQRRREKIGHTFHIPFQLFIQPHGFTPIRSKTKIEEKKNGNERDDERMGISTLCTNWKVTRPLSFHFIAHAKPYFHLSPFIMFIFFFHSFLITYFALNWIHQINKIEFLVCLWKCELNVTLFSAVFA